MIDKNSGYPGGKGSIMRSRRGTICAQMWLHENIWLIFILFFFCIRNIFCLYLIYKNKGMENIYQINMYQNLARVLILSNKMDLEVNFIQRNKERYYIHQ